MQTPDSQGTAEALKNLGNVHKASGNLQAAADAYRRALESAPGYVPALYNLGLVLRELNRPAEAEPCFRRVHELDPADADAVLYLGLLSYERDDLEGAVRHLQHSLELKPAQPGAQYMLGLAFRGLGRDAEAARSYRRAIELDPGFAEAHDSLGNVLLDEGRLDEAQRCYREAIRLRPGLAPAHNNLGCVLLRSAALEEAGASLQRAIRIKPDFPEAHFNLGFARSLQGRHDEALRAFQAALRLRPGEPSYAAHLLFEMQHVADWSRFKEMCTQARRAALEAAEQPPNPFSLLSIPSTPGEQLAAASSYARSQSRAVRRDREAMALRFERKPKARPKVGYLSGDYHEHATAYLAAELFELHDRSRFEIIGYSYGPDDGSPMRARLAKAFDRFVDLAPLSHAEAAAAIHADGVDILVDLKGYTTNARPAIVALRPAPIQVSYLGYPGTLGADFIDYVIGDPFVTPPGHAENYSEAIVRLPGSYQVNDRKRPLPAPTPRTELGLPEGALVFCCFNQTYKILPEVFSAWMRLLRAVPDSVLWLLEWNAAGAENLGREALTWGIDPGRVVFAPTVPLERHLARLPAADLFLDTLPYNAHTSASDALWTGVPIVTCAGDTFASRVAGSLLTAAGLPQLVTPTLEAYEALALRLARQPDELKALRGALLAGRSRSALFDTPRFVRGLEKAYERMWDAWLAGRPPGPIDV